MRTIFLCTGHNNAKTSIFSITKDKGASANGTNEFDFVNPIIEQVVRNGIPGFTLVHVPVGLNINQRISYINKIAKDGDIVIEFHLDSANNAEGCTTFYYTGSEYAQIQASKFQREYTRVTGIVGRGVKPDSATRFGRLGIVRDTKPLALLVELGFITNTNDLSKIKKYGVIAITEAIKKII